MSFLPLQTLGQDFFTPVTPAVFPKAKLIYFNQPAAKSLGQSWSDPQIQDHFWQFKPLPANLSQACAMKYHGHQFMHYNPNLGDGRGFTFAQFLSPHGSLVELGTKGSGQTPYSRQGDGRLTLKGAYREILATEYLKAMGVNTSQTFCVFETGEQLQRHDEPSPTKSAVLTRLSQGHIRFGSFQKLLTENKLPEIKRLLRYCILCFYPHLLLEDRDQILNSGFSKELQNEQTLFIECFQQIVMRHADLVASYMITGFVHGVLNTDNMNISGESFDYGPYRFLPHYDPYFTAAYFDHQGLYCFGRQPHQFHWNLEQLKICLSPIIEDAKLLDAELNTFQSHFDKALIQKFCGRLFLQPSIDSPHESANVELLKNFYDFAQQTKYPLDQLFFELTQIRYGLQPQKSHLLMHRQATDLLKSLEKNRTLEHCIPNLAYFQNENCQSLLIDEIETLWQSIDTSDDWSSLLNKLTLMRSIPQMS